MPVLRFHFSLAFIRETCDRYKYARNKTTSALVRISDENLHSCSFNRISPELSYKLKYSIEHFLKSADILIVKINHTAEKKGKTFLSSSVSSDEF